MTLNGIEIIDRIVKGAFMKYLFTAFKGKNNSSYQLVSQISGEKLFLTNSFEGLKRDIENCSDAYDIVIMFGLDKNLKNKVRIERVAEYENVTEATKIDIENIKKSLLENKVECVISDTPTRYLCNAAYFHMLKKTDGKAVFIHIPSLKNMSEDMIKNIGNCLERSKHLLLRPYTTKVVRI